MDGLCLFSLSLKARYELQMFHIGSPYPICMKTKEFKESRWVMRDNVRTKWRPVYFSIRVIFSTTW